VTELAGNAGDSSPTRSARLLLGLSAVAVSFAAADTYVVVLALPDMMSSVGLGVDELQRAAPIVSGFLLGYVAILPLIGRIADVRGRVPVLVGSLVVFALGSLVTAAAYDLPSMVTGRFLQGVGGGGLVPATLALVADRYPPARRGVPLGIVGAVQELGSVLGPLYGAVVLAAADWEDIFWINLAAGLVLAAVIRSAGPADPRSRRTDILGVALAALAVASLVLTLLQPARLSSHVTLGLAFVPVAGQARWLSPVGIAFVVLLVGFVIRCVCARSPLINLRAWPGVAAEADLPGAGLLALCLGGIILAFATADPEVSVLSPAGPWLLAGTAVAAGAFWWHSRRTVHPVIPRGAIAETPAWGALMVSFFIGAALIAALVDIPIFARVTVYPDSQLDAALVLVRLLVAIPVGALAGGFLVRRAPAGVVTAGGMALAGIGLGWMSRWGLTSLHNLVVTIPLVAAGLGFGLALAPVNAALLAATEDAVHGVTSALLVVARMVGMLVGISALTTIGLRRYYAVQVDLPSPTEVCATGSRCSEYTHLLTEAGLAQLQTVFVGAAACAALAALVALITFRAARTRGVSTADALRHVG
jgi:MFS family permease